MEDHTTSDGGKLVSGRIESSGLTRIEHGFLHQCVDGRTTLAVWEFNNHLDDGFPARMIIKASGLALVTEILTTLLLNRMSQWLSWEI